MIRHLHLAPGIVIAVHLPSMIKHDVRVIKLWLHWLVVLRFNSSSDATLTPVKRSNVEYLLVALIYLLAAPNHPASPRSGVSMYECSLLG